MRDRPGGTRELDKQVALAIGWTELTEINGHLDLVGKPPESDKIEPVPFYSSVSWLAKRAIEQFLANGGDLNGELPPEPWKICELIIKANSRRRCKQ